MGVGSSVASVQALPPRAGAPGSGEVASATARWHPFSQWFCLFLVPPAPPREETERLAARRTRRRLFPNVLSSAKHAQVHSDVGRSESERRWKNAFWL